METHVLWVKCKIVKLVYEDLDISIKITSTCTLELLEFILWTSLCICQMYKIIHVILFVIGKRRRNQVPLNKELVMYLMVQPQIGKRYFLKTFNILMDPKECRYVCVSMCVPAE